MTSVLPSSDFSGKLAMPLHISIVIGAFVRAECDADCMGSAAGARAFQLWACGGVGEDEERQEGGAEEVER
jgi:hypothetical protein